MVGELYFFPRFILYILPSFFLIYGGLGSRVFGVRFLVDGVWACGALYINIDDNLVKIWCGQDGGAWSGSWTDMILV